MTGESVVLPSPDAGAHYTQGVAVSDNNSSTVGSYLASRLAEIGIERYFAVPGDYNLVLLDELLTEQRLQMVGCCNELNAGYAADGYARATNGPAAAVVTYSVGGLSLVNAVAGAYAEDLPLIAISGGPNSNSTSDYELLHHTLGEVDYQYVRDMYARVTALAVMVMHPHEAPGQIDHAIDTALITRKPVYIEIATNIASSPISAPFPRRLGERAGSDPNALASAVDAAAALIGDALKPVVVAGVKLRSFGAEAAFAQLADASGQAVAVMPNAKGFFDETHDAYIGTYWGPVSSPGCAEIVESADLVLYAGGTFTDYTTVGHAVSIDRSKSIDVRPDHVVMPTGTFTDVVIDEFLSALAGRVEPNSTSLDAYRRLAPSGSTEPAADLEAPLTTRVLFDRIERLIDGNTTVIAETGDSWFNGVGLQLPSGARFEIQMQYGSIGWSVGATLGVALGTPDRRVVALIGDGSFQLTAQELSTMIRSGAQPLIFLINNGGYTIEVEIHDGPYNTIKNWDYAGLITALDAGDGRGLGLTATTPGELDDAIERAEGHSGPVLIECAIGRDDCSGELLAWGAHVAKNNGRPPRVL
jgi:TPP-dependent 2-oxoacid decarboxylase